MLSPHDHVSLPWLPFIKNDSGRIVLPDALHYDVLLSALHEKCVHHAGDCQEDEDQQ